MNLKFKNELINPSTDINTIRLGIKKTFELVGVNNDHVNAHESVLEQLYAPRERKHYSMKEDDVHMDILNALSKNGIEDVNSILDIIGLIAEGKIPHVKIEY